MVRGNSALEREYKRWKDYAHVLLIALAVLFAGPMIGGQKTIFSILSVGFGVAGIILVVLWYARERKIQVNEKPAFLLGASSALGAQAAFLVFHLIFS